MIDSVDYMNKLAHDMFGMEIRKPTKCHFFEQCHTWIHPLEFHYEESIPDPELGLIDVVVCESCKDFMDEERTSIQREGYNG